MKSDIKTKPVVYTFEIGKPDAYSSVIDVSFVFWRSFKVGAKNDDGTPKNEGDWIITLDASSVDQIVLSETTLRAAVEALDGTQKIHQAHSIVEEFALLLGWE